MIKFYDDKENLLVTYDSYINDDEIEATKELLEYENNCKVIVKITKQQGSKINSKQR